MNERSDGKQMTANVRIAEVKIGNRHCKAMGDISGNLAEVAEKCLKKGSKVYLEGQLQTRTWQDQSGQDRYTTEVVLSRFRGELTMLDGRTDGVAANSNSGAAADSKSDSTGGAWTMKSRFR